MSSFLVIPPINLLEEQVLDRLIIEEIQLQLADRAGIKISDSELNQTLSRVAGQNNLSLEEFRIKLEEYALNNPYPKIDG